MISNIESDNFSLSQGGKDAHLKTQRKQFTTCEVGIIIPTDLIRRVSSIVLRQKLLYCYTLEHAFYFPLLVSEYSFHMICRFRREQEICGGT